MAKVNVRVLEGSALEYAVGIAEKLELYLPDGNIYPHQVRLARGGQNWHPSTNWLQAGEIIEREKISVRFGVDDKWVSYKGNAEKFGVPIYWMEADTPLIAAMRCYVASKLGDMVEIPVELM